MSRKTPTAVPEETDAHRECWDLLPWLVTGRLSQQDRARVEMHLTGCLHCRDELAAQHQLRARLCADDRVTYSPAASFEKLWSRIEELEREVPDDAPADEEPRAPVSPADLPRRVRPLRVSQVSRWLVAAVIVQTLALAWLAASLVPQRSTPDWPFYTVTTSAPPKSAAPRFRVVFAADLTVAELQRALAIHGLVIAQGSSSAEVLILAPADQNATTDAGLLLERLRSDRRVRFAEPAGGAPAR